MTDNNLVSKQNAGRQPKFRMHFDKQPIRKSHKCNNCCPNKLYCQDPVHQSDNYRFKIAKSKVTVNMNVICPMGCLRETTEIQKKVLE